VVFSDADGSLAGIFTERDYLKVRVTDSSSRSPEEGRAVDTPTAAAAAADSTGNSNVNQRERERERVATTRATHL
jgi:hypothetical protein